MMAYTTGTITSVRNILLVSPPIIAQANPFFTSAPLPFAMAIGNIPSTMAMVVIMIGRSLVLPLSSMAFASVSPDAKF